MFYRFLTLLFLVLSAEASMGQNRIDLIRQDNKTLPALVYQTTGKLNCQGIVIFSHGAGGSEEGFSYLGEAMAKMGYLTLVLGHQESGRQVLKKYRRTKGFKEGLAELLTESSAYNARFMDIEAGKKWAQKRCRSSEAILMGHSMGAATVMIEAGAKNKLGVTGFDAFDIYVALSPQGVGDIFPADAWKDIQKPVLMLTGTRDEELDSTSWETRTDAFKSLPPGCKWLGVITGATHLNFAGIGFSRRTERLVVQTLSDFLVSYHKRNCALPRFSRGLIDIQAK